MKKFSKFLLTGSSAIIVGIATLSTIIDQDQWYDNAITKPLEQAQSYFGIKDQVKSKYEQFISDDKQFLSELNLPKSIVDTDIILKHHTNVDKTFYPLMKLGQILFNWNEDKKLEGDSKYKGNYSAYHAIKKNENIINSYIILGVNGLESKNEIYADLYKVFDNDEKKLTSFTFFHELGHIVSDKLLSEDKNIKILIDSFEKQNGITLSKEGKKTIQEQYSETFADAFAIAMMVKKYPKLNFEKTKEMIAGLRYYNAEYSHLTAPGIIELSKIDKDTNIENIFIAAEKSALTTMQFYSDINLSKVESNKNQAKGIDNQVKLINLDTISVRERMHNARAKFLTVRKSDNKKLDI